MFREAIHIQMLLLILERGQQRTRSGRKPYPSDRQTHRILRHSGIVAQRGLFLPTQRDVPSCILRLRQYIIVPFDVGAITSLQFYRSECLFRILHLKLSREHPNAEQELHAIQQRCHRDYSKGT